MQKATRERFFFFSHWQSLDFSPCCTSAQIAVTQDGQIQYLPMRTKQQIVSPEDLEAAAHSAVTGRLNEVNHFVY